MRNQLRTNSQRPSGTWYQIEIEAFWDGEPNEDIRVLGSIDDGFSPLSEAFIKIRRTNLSENKAGLENQI